MKKKKLSDQIIIYQAKSGALELRKDVQGQTIWATQAEMALLYGKDQSVISRHIASIFSDGEVDKKRNMQEMHMIYMKNNRMNKFNNFSIKKMVIQLNY